MNIKMRVEAGESMLPQKTGQGVIDKWSPGLFLYEWRKRFEYLFPIRYLILRI